MAVPSEMNAIGGVWCLGTITLTAGTPVSILDNVGGPPAQRASMSPPGRAYQPSCRQLLFSTTGNAGIVYIMDGPYPAADNPNRVVAILGAGISYTGFPFTALQESVLDLTRYYADCDTGTNHLTVAASDASS